MMLLIFITLVCCIEFVVNALQLHKKMESGMIEHVSFRYAYMRVDEYLSSTYVDDMNVACVRAIFGWYVPGLACVG